MFLETGSVLPKKAEDDRQKDQMKILKTVNKELFQRLTQETNLSFGTVQLILEKDLHFFLYRVSVVHEITP
jgi:ribosomal protein S25